MRIHNLIGGTNALQSFPSSLDPFRSLALSLLGCLPGFRQGQLLTPSSPFSLVDSLAGPSFGGLSRLSGAGWPTLSPAPPCWLALPHEKGRKEELSPLEQRAFFLGRIKALSRE